MTGPYHLGKPVVISLAISHLPQYALRTTLRLVIALMFSFVFSLIFGCMAAKNKHAERLILPLIDVFQSMPILGFLSIVLLGLIRLFPNSLLGPECAAIFVIFTSQTWNICLGFYQSLKFIPQALRDVSHVFGLNAWQRFWKVEVPFAAPSLIWNAMISLSASWFFITFSEAITVNNQQILLPGIGSYIALAIKQSNKMALAYAIMMMFIVILCYDQLVFRPLVAWSEKFKAANTTTEYMPKPFIVILLRKTHLLQLFNAQWNIFWNFFVNFPAKFNFQTKQIVLEKYRPLLTRVLVYGWYSVLCLTSIILFCVLFQYILQTISIDEVVRVVILGVYTSIRIIILMIFCSCFWVPIGVWIGMRPRVVPIVQPIAQFLAAFPANLLFPVVFMMIIKYHLNVQIWTTPLMILGTQWYVLFNVIAGTTALPKDLIYVTQNFGVKKLLWWRRFVLPGIFPYFITGAITAAGGAWNASIVAEVVQWGSQTLKATGLGAYIVDVTAQGDFPRITLGISIMCLYVLMFNHLVWQPLYSLAEKRFQLN